MSASAQHLHLAPCVMLFFWKRVFCRIRLQQLGLKSSFSNTLLQRLSFETLASTSQLQKTGFISQLQQHCKANGWEASLDNRYSSAAQLRASPSNSDLVKISSNSQSQEPRFAT